MKAKMFGIVAVLAILMSVAVLADVDVHGIVYQSDNATSAGPGVEVTVECFNDETSVSNVTQTITDGSYDYLFNSSECGLGDTVVASVPGDENSTLVTSNNFDGKLDLFIVPANLSIPEFSAIAASVALMGASAGYIALRKRK
ncbi:MAG: hypothetical protein EPN86_05770 [Nanoarchaeota archaeon]|nr:MAG: hypothetical protein EPN86_05770 [Nanoarchaeota archaeon]